MEELNGNVLPLDNLSFKHQGYKDEQKMLVLLEIKEKQIKYRTWLIRSKLWITKTNCANRNFYFFNLLIWSGWIDSKGELNQVQVVVLRLANSRQVINDGVEWFNYRVPVKLSVAAIALLNWVPWKCAEIVAFAVFCYRLLINHLN